MNWYARAHWRPVVCMYCSHTGLGRLWIKTALGWTASRNTLRRFVKHCPHWERSWFIYTYYWWLLQTRGRAKSQVTVPSHSKTLERNGDEGGKKLADITNGTSTLSISQTCPGRGIVPSPQVCLFRNTSRLSNSYYYNQFSCNINHKSHWDERKEKEGKKTYIHVAKLQDQQQEKKPPKKT